MLIFDKTHQHSTSTVEAYGYVTSFACFDKADLYVCWAPQMSTSNFMAIHPVVLDKFLLKNKKSDARGTVA